VSMTGLFGVTETAHPSQTDRKHKFYSKSHNKITVLLITKLSIRILTVALLSFCPYSTSPSGAFTVKSMENDSSKYLSINWVSILDICIC
jgi:hypothetical protein